MPRSVKLCRSCSSGHESPLHLTLIVCDLTRTIRPSKSRGKDAECNKGKNLGQSMDL
jgi:hypothetical protein